MTTKIPVELSSTPGIADSSNATAITIDSSENSTFAGNVKSPRYILDGTDSATTRYIFTDNTNTGDGRLIIQSGGGSGGYGGAINLYSHAHASKPGDVVAGISSGSSGAFRVNTTGIDSGSDVFIVKADGTVGIGTSSPTQKLDVVSTSAGNTTIPLVIRNSGSTSTGTEAKLFLSTVADEARGAFVSAIITDSSNGNALLLGTNTAGASPVERMRINSSGQLLLGTTSNNSDSYRIIVDTDGGAKGVDIRNISYNADNGAFRSVPSGNTSYRFAVMLNSSNSTVGKIEVTSANTTYTTSSDYRLKENVTPLENGLDRLNQLKPVKFNWIESGQEEEGFIAHEVDEIFSDAVVGEKDAVKDDGTVSPQTMDYGRITPLLVKAIQEQQEQIEQLKTEIQTLKGE